MSALKRKLPLAWKIYFLSYPITFFIAWLATFDPEDASRGMAVGFVFLLGLVFGGVLAIIIFYAEIKGCKRRGLKRCVFASIPLLIWGAYFYIMGFTSLGDQIFPN